MDEQKPEANKPEAKAKQKVVGILMFEAGMEFVFLIAVPLVAFLLLGRWLDSKYHQKFFTIIGILFGLFVSSYTIWKRIKDYRRMLK